MKIISEQMIKPHYAFSVDDVSKKGRTIMIQYCCKRCNRTYTEEVTVALDRIENNLFKDVGRLCAPGWREIDGDFLLCEKCYSEYCAFLDGLDVKSARIRVMEG